MLYSVELRSLFIARLLCGSGLDYALFADAGLLTGKVAEVEDAGTADFTDLVDSDAVDSGRLEGENPFHADSIGNLAYGEGTGKRSGAAYLDDHTAEILQTEFITFLDLAGYGNGVTGLEFGVLRNVLVYERLLCYFK